LCIAAAAIAGRSAVQVLIWIGGMNNRLGRIHVCIKLLSRKDSAAKISVESNQDHGHPTRGKRADADWQAKLAKLEKLGSRAGVGVIQMIQECTEYCPGLCITIVCSTYAQI
jgi:hypothetical protein